MTDIDSVDPSFDDVDADDYDLGKEEEAALLCEDDDDLLEELHEEEEQDNHRDKFASERMQAQQEEHENTQNQNNREHHQPRFNRNRLGGRGWGRGGPKPSYNNGPNRVSRQIYVNPSMFKKEQKPVQSVEPWLNPPRNYGSDRIVQSVPFRGHPPVYNQPQPIVNQPAWQPPIQQPQIESNNFERPMQQQQHQFYPPQMNQSLPQFQQQYSNQINVMHQSGPPKPNYNNPNMNQQTSFHSNFNNNFSQYPQQPYQSCYQNQSPQQFHAHQQFPPVPVNAQVQHNAPPMQPPHLSQHMPQNSNYYEPYPQQQHFNQNQSYPPHNHNLGPPQHHNQHFNHQNPGFTPLPRHPGPLLQRPAVLSHEGGQFREFTSNHQSYQAESHNRHFNQAPWHNFDSSPTNAHSRPWHQPQPEYRQIHNQNNFGHRGNYRGGRGAHNYNQRPAFKRRSVEWNGNPSDYNLKRRMWINEEEVNEEETQYEENDCNEEKEKSPVKVEIKIDSTPEIEEDEETKAYRLKIEEQKCLRLKILAEKERKRKEAILRKNGEVCDIPAIESSPQKEPQRVKAVVRSGVNPNLRVLTRSDGEKVELSLGNKAAALMKVKITPGSPSIASPDARKLTGGLFSNRQVIAKDESLIDTPLVIVRNLAASSTEPKLRKLCHSVGLVQSLEMSSKERQAKICFKSVSSAHAFYKKYQRHMLDLSLIKVELVPQKIAG